MSNNIIGNVGDTNIITTVIDGGNIIGKISGLSTQRLETMVKDIDSRVDTIITTPVEGVSAQEIIDARGGEATLGAKVGGIETGLNQAKIYVNLSKYESSVVSGDWAPALAQAHAEWVTGAELIIDRPTTLKTPFTWTKQANVTCVGEKGYFIAETGTLNDCLTFKGMDINSCKLDIKIFGLANACKNALTVDCVNLSRISATIKAGAVGYGYVSKGCLLTTHDVIISLNTKSSMAGAVMPANHILLDNGTTVVTENNASKFNLKLEGGGNGITKINTNFLETVEFTGTIEGLNGYPFSLNTVRYSNLNNLHLELNSLDSTFTNCDILTVGPAVRNNAHKINFANCNGIIVDGYSGSLEFDSACRGEVRNIGFDIGDKIINNSKAVSIKNGVVVFNNRTRYGLNGGGEDVFDNFFHNPYIDLWTLGDSAAPDGLRGDNLVWAKNTTIFHPDNPKKVSAYVQSTNSSINTGVNTLFKTEYRNKTTQRWVSFALWVYVPTGQPNLKTFMLDGVQLIPFSSDVTVKDQWVLVTGATVIEPSKNIDFGIRTHNGTAYVPGNFYIGGLNVSDGSTPPNKILDNGKRFEHIVSSDRWPILAPKHVTAPPTTGKANKKDLLYNDNPAPSAYIGWVCTVTGTNAQYPWLATTNYAVNSIRHANGNVYQATVAGLTSSTPPSHTSGTAVDGTVTWQFIDTLAVWKAYGLIQS